MDDSKIPGIISENVCMDEFKHIPTLEFKGKSLAQYIKELMEEVSKLKERVSTLEGHPIDESNENRNALPETEREFTQDEFAEARDMYADPDISKENVILALVMLRNDFKQATE